MAEAIDIVRKFFPNVKTVEDAKEPVTIEVTANDAKSKGRRDHKTCAFAVACQRLTRATGVIVSVATAYLIYGDQAFRYKIPQSVAREIISFDRDAQFATGTYQLAAVPPASRMGAYHQPHKSKADGTRKKLKVHKTTGIRTSLIEEK